MRKEILLLLLISVTTNNLLAQSSSGLGATKFGIRAGVNYSNMNFNKGYPTPNVDVKTIWKSGATFGFFLQVGLLKNLSFQPEYSYSQMQGKVESSEKTYHLDYLSLPLLVKLKVFKRLSLIAGPQFDLLINAKENSDGSNTKITRYTEERQIGFVGGVMCKVVKSFSVELRGMHGFNKVGLAQRTNPNEFKFELLQLAGSFTF